MTTLLSGRVWIVSAASARTQAATLDWLEAVEFHRRTGVRVSQVRFCNTRLQKGDICAGLGLTHFVDDRVHVMQVLRGIVPHLFLFTDSDITRNSARWATSVATWPEVIAAMHHSYRE